MHGHIAALARHPVKGFTPEPLASATLSAGAPFPNDRLYALEAGASGFDPAAPAHVSKMKFAVLAPLPALARVATRYDEVEDVWRAETPGQPAFSGRLARVDDRAAFAGWVEVFLDREAPREARGRLAMLAAPGHRFFDDPLGMVSLINLASVRDLGARMSVELDPARFRANIVVDGWPAWNEQALAAGAVVRLGDARLSVVKTIKRCVAVDVDPARGVRDVDVSAALHRNFGHVDCGLYLRVESGAAITRGDRAEVGA